MESVYLLETYFINDNFYLFTTLIYSFIGFINNCMFCKQDES